MDNVIKLKSETSIRKTLKGSIKITKEDGSFIEGHSVVTVLLYEVLNELKIMNKKRV